MDDLISTDYIVAQNAQLKVLLFAYSKINFYYHLFCYIYS